MQRPEAYTVVRSFQNYADMKKQMFRYRITEGKLQLQRRI